MLPAASRVSPSRGFQFLRQRTIFAKSCPDLHKPEVRAKGFRVQLLGGELFSGRSEKGLTAWTDRSKYLS